MTQDEAKRTLLALATAILETVRETPQGAPGGVLYAALMGHVSFNTFQQIMSGLVAAGKLRKSGELYYAVQP